MQHERHLARYQTVEELQFYGHKQPVVAQALSNLVIYTRAVKFTRFASRKLIHRSKSSTLRSNKKSEDSIVFFEKKEDSCSQRVQQVNRSQHKCHTTFEKDDIGTIDEEDDNRSDGEKSFPFFEVFTNDFFNFLFQFALIDNETTTIYYYFFF